MNPVRTVRLAFGIMIVTLCAVTPTWGQIIGSGVQKALKADVQARVIVALKSPPNANGSVRAKWLSVQSMQSAMLSRVSPDEFEVIHRYETVPALSGMVTEKGLAALLAEPEVVRIDLDAPGSGELAQSVPIINADILQSVHGLTGAGVTVAVLDSGMDRNHPDLVGALVGEQCFCSGGGGCCPNGAPTQEGVGAAIDDHFHGTHVTSILAGNGSVASVGVAPGVNVVAIKVLDRNNRFCCSSDVIAGLDWIISHRPDVKVVNMSLGTFATFSGDCDEATAFTMAFAGAINTLTSNGVAVFATSGNASLANAMKAPGCVANANSVGAVDKFDNVASFSDSGATLDLLAPGVGILAANNGGGVRVLSGTSMATPHAAGTAALLLEAHPFLKPEGILRALKKPGVMVMDPRNGLSHPRVDAEAAFLFSEVCDDGMDNDEDELVDAEDPDCPDVKIDIIPQLVQRPLRLFSRRLLPVGIFGSEEADVRDLDLTSLSFGPAEALPWHDLTDAETLAAHLRDLNGDGITDLITHFRMSETGISFEDTEACLIGGIEGEGFRACDVVKVLCSVPKGARYRLRRYSFPPFPQFVPCSHSQARSAVLLSPSQ